MVGRGKVWSSVDIQGRDIANAPDANGMSSTVQTMANTAELE